MSAGNESPTVFLSYAWEDDAHREWVHALATRLRQDGVDVILDTWTLQQGDNLREFMEDAIRRSGYVLCICTPKYAEKADARRGGVGYESQVIASELLVSSDARKFIPILRKGDPQTALPTWLKGRFYIDMSGDSYSEQQYEDLIRVLYQADIGVGRQDSRSGSSGTGPSQTDSPIDDTASRSADSLYVLADLAEVPADLVVQLMRDLNDLHLAMGGAGLHVRSIETGAAVADGAVV